MTWLSDGALHRLQAAAREAGAAPGRYTIGEAIGRGGMGIVHRAVDETLGRDVAMKIVNGDARPRELADRMAREAQVLARLEHPGIVPVHDAGTLADGRAFYVMKLVRGVSLIEHLATVERSDERLRVFERICEPVAFAHANQVVHRDLKPANVMVGSFGEVLVLDWGLAKTVGDRADAAPAATGADGASAIAGTPGYMAPEQARGDAAVDARADVYALGALLVTIAAGRAEDGTPDFEALDRAGLPAGLRAICRKALAPVPADRYPDAAALADDVARLRARLPVSAHRETLLDRARRFAARHRTAIVLVVAYLIMRTMVAIYVATTR